MRKFVEPDVADNPLYHDTWKLLKKYRDVVWSLELSVQHVRTKFEIEYGTSIEDFLDSVYLAGADLAGSDIEHHAKCIERSHKMLKLLDSAVELLRTKHKNGEAYYWLLYYSFLSPQQLKNVEEIIETLRPHIRDISFRTYYRKRREAIEALSSVLWGYTSKDSLDMPRFSDCVVCFTQVYDQCLPTRRIRDYDNLEEKQLLDVLSTFVMADDTGLLCDAYNTAALGEKDCTRISVMEKKRFPAWLAEHENTLKSISDF